MTKEKCKCEYIILNMKTEKTALLKSRLNPHATRGEGNAKTKRRKREWNSHANCGVKRIRQEHKRS